MELKKISKSILAFIKKYRYVAIILLVGLVFMCLPGKSDINESTTDSAKKEAPVAETVSFDELLSQFLRKIDGAGDVQVLLTLAKGEETVYQTDTHTSANGDSSTAQVDTVIISTSDRDQTGLIRQINPPTYMGVIVVCQGADNPTVRYAIVDAVSKITGLGADRISVLKMK